MARVIPFDQLRPGMTVWEERKGGGLVVFEVINKRKDGSASVEVAWYSDRGYGPTELTEGRTWMHGASPGYRYWNSKPTMEERQSTPWTEGSETK